MPSLRHEVLVDLFRENPQLLATLLMESLHLHLPTFTSIRAQEGKIEAQAGSILAILRQRGLAIHPADEQRIQACKDMDLLRRWLLRSVTASTVAEIFAEP